MDRDDQPTIEDRVKNIEQFCFNFVKHELKWHRILLLIIIAAIIGAAIAR